MYLFSILFLLCFSKSLNSEGDSEYTKRQKSLSNLKEQLAELENKCTHLNQDIKNKHQALLKGKEERDKLRYNKVNQLSCKHIVKEVKVYDLALFVFTRLEERNVQASYESKLKRKNQLLASRSNKLKRFGDQMPDMMSAISEAYATGRFLKRPVGPIGNTHFKGLFFLFFDKNIFRLSLFDFSVQYNLLVNILDEKTDKTLMFAY